MDQQWIFSHLSGSIVEIRIEFVNDWTKLLNGSQTNLIGAGDHAANGIDGDSQPYPAVQAIGSRRRGNSLDWWRLAASFCHSELEWLKQKRISKGYLDGEEPCQHKMPKQQETQGCLCCCLWLLAFSVPGTVFALALVGAESRESCFSKPTVESDRLNQFYVEGQTVSITSPTNS